MAEPFSTFIKIIFLIINFFLVLQYVSCFYRKGSCPNNKSLNNIDLNRFFTREWHEIQITPFNFGDVDKCGTITFNVTGNDVGYKYSQQGKTIFSTTGRILKDENQINVLIQFPTDDSESKLYVLGTDYHDYGVLYTCSQESNQVAKERLFVLSRENELKSELHVSEIIRGEGLNFEVGSRLQSCDKSSASIKADTECFPVKPLEITVYSFFNWFWYEYNRTTTTFDSETTCGRFAYEHAPALPGDPELVVLDHRYPQSEYNFVVFGNATTENNQTTVTVTFKTDTQQSKYYVLYNDRETALVYSCAKEPAELRERSWILNRYNNVSRDVMLNIEAVIDDQGSGFRERLSGMKYCGDIKLPQTCYNISSKLNLDLNRFSSGTWNEVWRSKNNIDTGNECGKIKYNYLSDRGQLNITHEYSNGKTINGTGKALKSNGIVTIKNVQFPKIRKREKSNYVVVDTDYDNYAVVYNCWQKSMSTREERVWVLSRLNQIPAKGRERIEADGYLKKLMEDGIVCQ